MRKIVFCMVFIAISAHFMPACNSSDTEKPNTAQAPPHQGNFKDIGILDRNDGRRLVSNYLDHFGNVHTKAVWFEKDVIRLLYDSLYGTPGRFDGVRVYLGVYPPGFP